MTVRTFLLILLFSLLISYLHSNLGRFWVAIKRRRMIAALPLRIQAELSANVADTKKALALISRLPIAPRTGEDVSNELWLDLNSVVNVSVNCGNYVQAIAFVAPWEKLLHASLPSVDAAIVLINQAEALHNLGRDSEALTLLDEVEQDLDECYARSGLQVLRAWILVHRGELVAAHEQLALAERNEDLRMGYSAELEMTRAALQREYGKLNDALASVELAIAAARRAASQRNALIMRASILTQQGEFDAAQRDFQNAFRSKYKAQAAYGLLRYGALLLRQQDTQQADTAGAINPSNFLLTKDCLPEALRAYWQRWDSESALTMRIPSAPVFSNRFMLII